MTDVLCRFVLAAFVTLAFCLLLSALAATKGRAHSWYPIECCSDRDCFPLPDGEVGVSAGGYVLKSSGEVIPFKDAKQSPDGAYHLCRSEYTKGILCFFAPPQGS